MRISHTLIITFVVVSLVTVAEGQSKTLTGMYQSFFESKNVPAPTADTPKIDLTKVKFLRSKGTSGYPQGDCSVGFGDTVQFFVAGIVSPDVDISDDATALQILQMGITFGREQCPPRGENFQGRLYERVVSVVLYPGNPTKYTVENLEEIRDAHYSKNFYDENTEVVYGAWVSNKPGLIVGYSNHPKAFKLSQAYDAQEARKRAAALEQERQAEQTRRNQIAARLAAFVKTYRVKRFVNGSQLAANPFVYQGQVVGMTATFVRMKSATQAIFSNGNNSFVVSGVPTARFTRQGSLLMLAGRVLESGGLTFVGSVFCQQWGCSDYIQ